MAATHSLRLWCGEAKEPRGRLTPRATTAHLRPGMAACDPKEVAANVQCIAAEGMHTGRFADPDSLSQGGP